MHVHLLLQYPILGTLGTEVTTSQWRLSTPSGGEYSVQAFLLSVLIFLNGIALF